MSEHLRRISLTVASLLLSLAAMSPLLARAQSVEQSDPFRPPHVLPESIGLESEPADLTALKLRAVLVSEGRRVAIINDERFGVGDSIGSSKILQIGTSHVTLENEDGKRRIELGSLEVKRGHEPSAPTEPWIGPPASPKPDTSNQGRVQ